MSESMFKSIFRPIYGTIALQPLVIIWCAIYNIPYWDNLGLFSVICTIWLIPCYRALEKYWPNPPKKSMWE